jgi:phosphoenolpyruvate synthase/pyruvate phosphate dikinase
MYRNLEGEGVRVPTASIAGQQESHLNIHGSESLLDACR